MKENAIVSKSYAFAIKAVKFCFEIQKKQKEYIISRQLLKSATSIGANIEEAQGAISKAEFILKVQIALKEAKETKYWLRLINDAEVYQNDFSEGLLKNCNELIVIITSILKSSKGGKK
jgi:four helix bundle protein